MTSNVFGQPRQGNSLFSGLGQSTQQQQPQQQSGGIFGLGQSTQQQPQQQSGGLFGGLGQSTQQQPQQQHSGSLFGGLGQSTQQQPQQQSSNFLGQSTQQQPQPQINGTFTGSTSVFGQSTQQSQQGQSQLGQSQLQPPPLQLGQSQQGNNPGSSQNAHPMWVEGKGLEVYRTIPAQASIIAEKWNPFNLNSPLRTYLYQVVNENEAPFFQPNLNYDPNSQIPQEDEQKWEEAALKRPEAKEGVAYVPALVTGFLVLGKRAQRQREFIEKCNIRLHDINASLDAQLEIHSQRIATRVTECRRRHIVASQRTLALAAKIQILRNRGYVMDNAEEELSTKLKQLEREVFDPTLNGREQEIWARMLGIRERGKRLKAEMEKAGPTAKNEDASLDEETVQIAKKALEAYETQLRHLQKELQLVQQEYDDWDARIAKPNTGSELGR